MSIKKPLNTETFTISSHETRFEIFKDEQGKPYKIKYQVTPGEQKGTIEVKPQLSTLVLSWGFLILDNEEASFTIKPDIPELEVMIKAKLLPSTSNVESTEKILLKNKSPKK